MWGVLKEKAWVIDIENDVIGVITVGVAVPLLLPLAPGVALGVNPSVDVGVKEDVESGEDVVRSIAVILVEDGMAGMEAVVVMVDGMEAVVAMAMEGVAPVVAMAMEDTDGVEVGINLGAF